ncbi:uncharacterized protein LOC141849428 isoform X2 [Brevipalpus obovatus]|uniref:uncharacterized protein LOC141849428 isoform X2 n=1 Tax=Brevipalpus obovatus TaxID=246614 RepID=UPI003D9E2559
MSGVEEQTLIARGSGSFSPVSDVTPIRKAHHPLSQSQPQRTVINYTQHQHHHHYRSIVHPITKFNSLGLMYDLPMKCPSTDSLLFDTSPPPFTINGYDPRPPPYYGHNLIQHGQPRDFSLPTHKGFRQKNGGNPGVNHHPSALKYSHSSYNMLPHPNSPDLVTSNLPHPIQGSKLISTSPTSPAPVNNNNSNNLHHLSSANLNGVSNGHSLPPSFSNRQPIHRAHHNHHNHVQPLTNQHSHVGYLPLQYQHFNLNQYHHQNNFKRDSYCDATEYFRATRSRSSSPHYNIRYRRYMTDTQARYYDYFVHDQPRKQLRTRLLPDNRSIDPAYHRQCQTPQPQPSRTLHSVTATTPTSTTTTTTTTSATIPSTTVYNQRQFSLLSDKNGLLAKANSAAMESMKENVNYYTIMRDSNNLSVKRRPSDLSLIKTNGSSPLSPTSSPSISTSSSPSSSPKVDVEPITNVNSSPISIKVSFQRNSVNGLGSEAKESIIYQPQPTDLMRASTDQSSVSDHIYSTIPDRTPLKISNNNNNNNIGNKLTSEFTGPRSLPITPGIHIDHHLKGVKFIKNDAENGHQNKTSSQQAATPLSMNILRLGPRILWCELPQVRELGLLRKLTPGQRQLQEAMFEVITSEASYLSSLDILVNHFMHNIMYSETIFLDSRHKADIFSNICVIREVSGALMSIFEQRWKQNIVLSDICDILADYALSHFGPYVTYCRYKRRQEETLRDVQLSSKFAALLKQLESDPICQGLTFHSYLLLPLQRVTRYPLLIEAILRRTLPDSLQYRLCKKALFVTDKLVKECNTAANQYDNYMDLVSRLKFTNIRGFSLNEPRWLILNVEVTRIKPETQSSILLGNFRAPHWSNSSNILSIMSDMVVLSKKKGDDLIVYDYCFRDLVQLRRIDGDSNERIIFNYKAPENLKNLVKMIFLHNYRGKRAEYCFNYNSSSNKLCVG